MKYLRLWGKRIKRAREDNLLMYFHAKIVLLSESPILQSKVVKPVFLQKRKKQLILALLYSYSHNQSICTVDARQLYRSHQLYRSFCDWNYYILGSSCRNICYKHIYLFLFTNADKNYMRLEFNLQTNLRA